METNIPASTDTIQVNKKLHFEQIADICGVSLEQIKSLNPQYKKNVIPGDSKPYNSACHKITSVHSSTNRTPSTYTVPMNYLKTEKQSLSETIHLQVRQEEKRLSAMGNWFITKSAVVKRGKYCRKIQSPRKRHSKLEWAAKYQDYGRKTIENIQ